jgi:hypothetical protein
MSIEDVIERTHEYCRVQKAYGIKTGDRVKVLRRPRPDDIKGWWYSWAHPWMTDTIGRTYKVREIDGTAGVQLEGTCSNPEGPREGYWYPFYVLQKTSNRKL